jgi:hypothetical protein
MKSASEIIDKKGAAAIATAAGVPIGTVRVWKVRNQIPRARWPELIKAFPDLTMDRLIKSERVKAAAV